MKDLSYEKYIMKKFIYLLVLCFLISGCSTTPEVARMEPLPRPSALGVYHQIAKGETLWRIGKSYNVEISKIVSANRLGDPSKIEVNQMLFIPGALIKQDIVVKYSPTKTSKDGFILPVNGKIISYYGHKNGNIINRGIDIQASEGAAIAATKDGIVTFCDNKVKGFGKTIIIDHMNSFSTVYAYNSENSVKAGDKVKRGQVIGKVGKSSRTGVYTLHFEIRKNQKTVNPFYYLP